MKRKMVDPESTHELGEKEPCIGCLNSAYYIEKVKEFLLSYETALDYSTSQIGYYTWLIRSCSSLLEKEPNHSNKDDIERNIKKNIGKIRYHTKKQVVLQTKVDTLKNELLTGDIPMYGDSDTEI